MEGLDLCKTFNEKGTGLVPADALDERRCSANVMAAALVAYGAKGNLSKKV